MKSKTMNISKITIRLKKKFRSRIRELCSRKLVEVGGVVEVEVGVVLRIEEHP